MAQDKKFSIICPLYKDGYKTLDRFLLCIAEQDWKNVEVIFSINSPDGEAKAMADKYAKQPNFDRLHIQVIDAGYDPDLGNGNHCNSFNKGAAAATGDYLIFLDPDSYLYPGILREYHDAFTKYGVDFVYGDYDFDGGAGRIVGRPYSEYELKCANYISGSFPIKRAAFKGWDPEVKALQDWDMWLSAAQAGATGHYIARPCFVTGIPTDGGISAHGANNWAATYEFVRNKHNLPIPVTVVTSLGAPFHATNAARILGVDSRVLTTLHTHKPHTYQNVYLLGFYPEAWQSHLSLFMQDGKVIPGKHLIHWIGTDIYQMQHRLSWIAWQNIVTFLKDPEFSFVHLTEHQATHDELLELGIESDIVPLPPGKRFDLMPLPEKFTVGIYINPTQDMYFQEFCYDLADSMPDVDFKFFGDRNQKKIEANKEWCGFVDMAEFLPKISSLVRLTVHDGLPLGPLEAMMAGRNVLTSAKLKYALHAEYVNNAPVKEQVVEQIREMEKLPLNTEASTYWRKELDPATYQERISSYLK